MKKCENPLIPEITKTCKKRMFNLSSIKLPEGIKKKCVWCLGSLSGQQRRWCGEECVNAAQAWGYPQKEYGLGVLLIRQEFKCKICSFDWGTIIEEMYKRPKVPYGMVSHREKWRTVFSYWLTKALKDHMHSHDKPHRIEVDHILAISKGGQSLGLDNHQAICFDCHKAKTKIDNSGPRKNKVDKSSTVEDTDIKRSQYDETSADKLCDDSNDNSGD